MLEQDFLFVTYCTRSSLSILNTTIKYDYHNTFLNYISS